MSFAEFCEGVCKETLHLATWSPTESSAYCAGADSLESFTYAFQAYMSREAYELLLKIHNQASAAHAVPA